MSSSQYKKTTDLPIRAKMLKLLYVDGELPENDSIVNMFCGQSVSHNCPFQSSFMEGGI